MTGIDGPDTAAPRAVALVNAFTGFDEAHGAAVNLFAVIVLAVSGAAFASLQAPAHPAGAGPLHRRVPGGLGPDRGLRLLRRPRHRPEQHDPVRAAGRRRAISPSPARRHRSPRPQPADHGDDATRWQRLREAARPAALAAASIESVAALGAIGVIVLGAAPMAVAQADPVADTILAQAIDGSSAPLNFAAPGFSLTSQYGEPVTLSSLRGKVLLLTFLDPVCTSDCPLIAQEFRLAGQLLGSQRSAGRARVHRRESRRLPARLHPGRSTSRKI